jgi:hypothetical protein
LLIGLVVTDRTAHGGAKHAMMASHMPRHSTHNGSLDAAFGLSWGVYGKKRHSNRGTPKCLFHDFLPIQAAKATDNFRLPRLVPPLADAT